MSRLHVLRAVSGAGKSTRAKELVQEWIDKHTPFGGEGDVVGITESMTLVCSTDDFFVARGGRYEFDAKKLSEAHAWNRGRVRAAMELGIGLVVVDNTNTRRWEYQPYLDMATQFGYETEEEIVGKFDEASLKVYANRNRHGVPLEAIRKMAARFQK